MNTKRLFPIKDLVGQQYGRLVVKKFTYYKLVGKNNRVPHWLCLCECGNEKNISQVALITRATRSCGCLLKESYKTLKQRTAERNSKPKGIASFNALFGSYKSRAKKLNIIFELSENDFKTLTKQSCFYCDLPPSQIYGKNKCNGEYIYSGIDRKDSKIGYTINNCVSCCGQCNYMKLDFTTQEFFDKICKIWNKHLNKFK